MTPEQFQKESEEFGEKLSLITLNKGKGKPASVEDWDRVFPDITPKQLYERFAKVAGDVPISMRVFFTKNDSFTSVAIGHDSTKYHGSREKNKIGFVLYPDRQPLLDAVDFQGKKQGKNLAKRYVRSVVDLVKDRGADCLRVGAVEVGGYAWAKYGFVPSSSEEWDKLKKQIKCDSGKIEFMHKKYDVSAEMPVISRVLNSDYADLPKTFPMLTELNRVIGSYDGHPLTVGKALLIDKNWSGMLSLDEQNLNFQRFKSYTDSATRDLQIG